MSASVPAVMAFISMGNALWGSEWFQFILNGLKNKEITFNLTDEDRTLVLNNLVEKQSWLTEDSKPFNSN